MTYTIVSLNQLFDASSKKIIFLEINDRYTVRMTKIGITVLNYAKCNLPFLIIYNHIVFKYD